MVGAHRAHIDGLDTADAAVVFDLDAGEISHGVGHGVAFEGFEALAVEHLRRDCLPIWFAADDLYLHKADSIS